MLLLIDAGNTSVKFATSAGRGFRALGSIPTGRFTARAAKKYFRGADACVFCSVVPRVTSVIKKICSRKKIKWMSPGWRDLKNIKFGYSAPARIGADRIAVINGALCISKPPFIVVDIGTAVTCEVVTKNCIYPGGVIFPGIEMSLSALGEKTALLPKSRFRRSKRAAGRETRECMSIGVFNSITGGIEKSVGRMLKTYPGAKVFLTGSGSKYFRAGDFSFKVRKDDGLVFRGLLQFYRNLL